MTVVRTRFAPSPTGSLHVGGVRTALYCILHAHGLGGHFVLRIEDTDRARSTEEATVGILRDLRWLGLQWDEGPEVGGPGAPYLQSQRRDRYQEIFQTLIDGGYAYEAWETREELDALRLQAQKRKETFRYRRGPVSAEQAEAYRAEGRISVLRLRRPNHPITVPDDILGDVTVQESDLEDIVIRKADGWPTYHFAVVVDDNDMAITQVLRGQEHLLNTPKHMGQYEALGWELPRFAHLPLIFNPTGSKMSKRDKAKAARAAARSAASAQGHPKGDWTWLSDATELPKEDIEQFMKKKHDRVPTATAIAQALDVELPMIEVMDFRRGGYIPEALINYMALLGWNPGDEREILSLEEMVACFTLERVGKTAARFDPVKLRWMNGEYMKLSTDERILEVLEQYLEVADSWIAKLSQARRLTLLGMYRERAATFAELTKTTEFFVVPPTEYNGKASRRHILKGGGLDRLQAAGQALSEVEDWTPAGIEARMQTFLAAHEVGLGKVAQPLRIALTGNSVSPSLYDTLAFFERDEVIRRIDAAVAHFSQT